MANNNILLRGVPIDVIKVISKEQQKQKDKRCVRQFSMSTTIIKIIREWNNKCNSYEEK